VFGHLDRSLKILPGATVTAYEPHGLVVFVRSIADIIPRVLAAVITRPREAEIVPLWNGHLARDPAAVEAGDHDMIIFVRYIGRVAMAHGNYSSSFEPDQV
jgi:hypothetical protein